METLIIVGISFLSLLATIITWFGVPGTFLMSIFAFVWGCSTGFSVISVSHILIMFGISVILEISEFFLGGITARYYGASRRSALFAVIGGIIGAVIGVGVFILIGAFLGLLIGSYLGAYISEKISGKTDAESVRAAFGAVMGNVVSKAIKSIAIIVMAIWMITVLT